MIDNEEKKFVCSDCVNDRYLKIFIKNHCDSKAEKCSYCGKEQEKVIEENELFTQIKKSIELIYEPCPIGIVTQKGMLLFGSVSEYDCDNLDNNNENWESQKINTNVFSSSSSFKRNIEKDYFSLSDFEKFEDINGEFNVKKILVEIFGVDKLFRNATKAIAQNLYQRKKFKYNNKIYSNKWDLFCDYVKFEQRFLFDVKNDENINAKSSEINFNIVKPSQILDDITSIIKSLDNKVFVSKNNIYVYRARPFEKAPDFLLKQENLVNPPPYRAKSPGRMSPEGISYFYCAEDDKTAVEEVSKNEPKFVAVGKWKIIKELKLIDFDKFIGMCKAKKTKKDNLGVIGFFDYQMMLNYFDYDFIESFAETIRKPNNGNKLDYIPTQIITSYLKEYFGKKINGVAYSSVYTNEQNYCLFISHKEALDGSILQFYDDEIQEITNY